MTKKIVNTVAFLILSTILTAAQMQMPAGSEDKAEKSSAMPKTLTGVVSDSMCGAHHMAKDKSPAECTRMCVQQGQKYALVVGKKVYTLEGHESEVDKLAGSRATVKGTVKSETVTVDSVAPAKTASK
jgi:hypothetical protein